MSETGSFGGEVPGMKDLPKIPKELSPKAVTQSERDVYEYVSLRQQAKRHDDKQTSGRTDNYV